MDEVVDTDFMVRGISYLYVVDALVFPVVTTDSSSNSNFCFSGEGSKIYQWPEAT